MILRASIVLAFLAVAAAVPAPGQEVRAEETDLLNYAFASQVGSGVYSVNGRTVQIYRLPIGVRLRSREDERWGVQLTLPVTLGFYDFKPRDLPQTGLPEEIGTMSFVPGVKLEVPMGKSWTLMPFAEGGLARESSTNARTWVYAAGLQSAFEFPWRELEGRLHNRFLWAGITGDGNLLSDDYGELETGVELSNVLWFSIAGRPVDAGLFLLSYLYFDPLEGVRDPGTRFETREQWEFGFTLGTRPVFSWKKVRMPRIGVSYRFGDGISAVRLVLGAPF